MSFTRRPGSGHLRQTSRREDRHIVRNACVKSTASSAAIQAQVSPSFGAPVSSRTIRRRLAEGHLGSRRPLRALLLTPIYRRLLLGWCRARGKWTAAEWNQVIFSDESIINLSIGDNRVREWIPCGERLNPAFALQLTMIGLTRQDCLRTVTTLPWPARFPDLSPIERFWDHLGRRVRHSTNLNELEARLQQIWNEMSQDIIQNLYASMFDRIASCIRARRGSTGYLILRSFAFFSEINYPFSLIL
ncbi:transposable element Tcb2 transposase [Trichonephila clavipes]|nr:transposable element Tcb2 transposase [Trichonephila clavipes]